MPADALTEAGTTHTVVLLVPTDPVLQEMVISGLTHASIARLRAILKRNKPKALRGVYVFGELVTLSFGSTMPELRRPAVERILQLIQGVLGSIEVVRQTP